MALRFTMALDPDVVAALVASVEAAPDSIPQLLAHMRRNKLV